MTSDGWTGYRTRSQFIQFVAFVVHRCCCYSPLFINVMNRFTLFFLSLFTQFLVLLFFYFVYVLLNIIIYFAFNYISLLISFRFGSIRFDSFSMFIHQICFQLKFVVSPWKELSRLISLFSLKVYLVYLFGLVFLFVFSVFL